MRYFVTVGSSLDPFDRMLRLVDEALPRDHVEGTCQHGVSQVRPRGLTAQSTLSKRQFEEHMRSADVVVCHAGVGTLWSAIDAGHKPIVVARRSREREIVNDHQLEICKALRAQQRITVVETVDELREALIRPTRRLEPGTLSGDPNRFRTIELALQALSVGVPRRPRRWLLRALALPAPSAESMWHRR